MSNPLPRTQAHALKLGPQPVVLGEMVEPYLLLKEDDGGVP